MKEQAELASKIQEHLATGRQFLAPAGTTLDQAHATWETYASLRQKRTHMLHAASVGGDQVLVRITPNPEHVRAVREGRKSALQTIYAAAVIVAFYTVLYFTEVMG